jgi:hypothetical protein
MEEIQLGFRIVNKLLVKIAVHHVYEKVFELLLRLKANYLWPAIWGNAFNDDDTLNPILADKYGIVMGHVAS